ncbi:glycosyltransferase [Bradyrhizobium sp.]|uniref:glycosyltransferase n=1 Tax=Bradyrhizobium sp. TaxID=376 RepID=UPI002E063990|nr:glycosyltransferase [Bradyrhizobium sp.]
MKVYGIYLAYAPTIDLQYQGLGRYLAYFLKAAAKRSDVRFVVACPSWTTEGLLQLCESEGLAAGTFDIISLPDKPLLLRAYERYLQYKRRPFRPGIFAAWRQAFLSKCMQHRLSIERRLATSRSALGLLPWLIYVVALGVLLLPVLLVMVALKGASRLFLALRSRFVGWSGIARNLLRLQTLAAQPKEEALVLRLYHFMAQHETDVLIAKINRLTHVAAWYSPTAFWPSFNAIKAPHVMCVPDVVLKDFPVGFAHVGGDRFLENFRMVEKAIEGGNRFITYSNDIKWSTLVDHYGVNPDSVDVVPHAVNDLHAWVNITGFADNEATGRRYAEALFSTALGKATNIEYAGSFANRSARFLFYPSQFRPSKNVLGLLLAYHHLLKQRYLGHKLILTGNPKDMPEIGEFIRNNNLANDVLCLHGLTVPELAACYRLADLAINPSLSEGGCPFTFSEALSVGTPVVMARIAVTEEVITDPELRAMMLFDPYVWQDMADRIEWAIQNRDRLRSVQMDAFKAASLRTWDDVVADHIEILNRISAGPAAALLGQK